MKILVLTSKENFIWLSMQEIIPYLEHSWQTLNPSKYQVDLIDIDKTSFSEMLATILQADRIVSTCFNFKMCQILKFIRANLKLEIPVIHYVHNMATIGFWPFRVWGGPDFFLQHDIFVVTCERDIQSMQLICPQARVFKIPFGMRDAETVPDQAPGPVQQLVYVGRISPQKNLHGLLLGYASLVLKNGDQIPPLFLFGKEDHLGSPNMNLKNQDYLQFLLKLVETLSLQGKVHFLGHRDRREIREWMEQKKTLLVSSSLHSDENFGMVVLQALLLNTDCVITDWGGYPDFKKYFPENIELIPVHQSYWGPAVLPQQIAECLEKKILNGNAGREGKPVPEYYRLIEAHRVMETILSQTKNTEFLEFSEVADRILDKLWSKKESANKTQIFDSFQDPLFHEISETYLNQNVIEGRIADNFQLAPWIEESTGEFFISDPHKGPIALKNSEDAKIQLWRGGYLF